MIQSDRRFPGGSYRITAAENAALCAAVGGEPDSEGRAHPLFYYIATQVAMGISVADLCAMCDFDVADGPMMTRSDATFERELMVNCDYSVAGGIFGLTRKPSRTFGAVDQLDFRLTMTQTDGALAATATSQWILPHRGETA